MSLKAEAWASDQLIIQEGSSSINFEVRSTLHPVHGQAGHLKGKLDLDDQARKASGEVLVLANDLDTHNVKRDKKMKHMLHVEMFPQIICRLDELQMEPVVQGKRVKGHIKGELFIGGKSNPIDTDIDVIGIQGGIQLQGNLNLSLAAYDLHPPSVMGLIKVADQVKIDFNVSFVKG
jgi:polyisoprenoid-binding protein YceI